MRIAFVVNDIMAEDHRYATTRLARTCLARGHETYYINVSALEFGTDDVLRAHAIPAPEKDSAEAYLEALQDQPSQPVDIDALDVLFLRNDPAPDLNERPWAIHASITFGQLAADRGVLVVNDPVGMSRALDKLYLQQFPRQVRPAGLITRNIDQIRTFIDEQDGAAVLKPLQGSGGQGVFLVRPEDGPNVTQMIEAVLRDGYVVAQEYLPEASAGDVRMFLVNGKPLEVGGTYAAFRRVAPGEDLRSNMHAGGTAEVAEVSDAMMATAQACEERLVRDGMFFVGLDFVGDRLVELNVCSPGGLNSLHEITGIDFAVPIVESLELKLELARDTPRIIANTELAVF